MPGYPLVLRALKACFSALAALQARKRPLQTFPAVYWAGLKLWSVYFPDAQKEVAYVGCKKFTLSLYHLLR